MTLTDTVTRLRTRPRSRGVGLIPYLAFGLDFLVILATTLAALASRNMGFFDPAADIDDGVGLAGPLVLVAWLGLIWLVGGYRSDKFGAGTEEYKQVLNAGLLMAGLLCAICYLGQIPLSRGFSFTLFAVGIPALLVERRTMRRLIHRARARGSLLQRVLIAGSVEQVDEVAAVLRRERWLGYQVLGALTPAHDRRPETPSGIPVVGNAHDVTVMHGVDVVFFAGGSDTSASQMRSIVWDLESHDVQIVVAPSVSEISSDRVRVRPVGGLPLMHIAPPTYEAAARLGKRAFDLVGSAVLLAVLSPLFLAVSLAIRVRDGGPLLFRQTRVGLRGKEFTCLKFRSMVVDAEERLRALHLLTGHEAGLFKLKEDPRVTKSGRWLRRYSIDELPQLVNVLRGDMSLVGPRPPLPHEVADYGDDTVRRLHVRPGLTGLWQVSGRSDLSWEDAVRLDLYYVDNWSMMQDLSILLRTFGAVLGSRGAY
ncbi:sugar transferase [Nocardioides plantarum]|uniref:Sugar transferase n=1 Tax=Nocardioides plantarum TaxID=29299 RepID=A0ABV5K6I2_9ACTN|nr:sugar transferase [Nocardioides plantarum]